MLLQEGVPFPFTYRVAGGKTIYGLAEVDVSKAFFEKETNIVFQQSSYKGDVLLSRVRLNCTLYLNKPHSPAAE